MTLKAWKGITQMSAKEDAYENEHEQVKYLIQVKKYTSCLGCGTLIAPSAFGYDVSMCEACQNSEMKES